MPRNARRPAASTASQLCKKNPTLHLSLPKLPEPMLVPDNEMEEVEEVDENDIETQSEDSQYPLLISE
ncbi:predicted protein [Histoplasma mississippiense (nom. inval.)]|uniref:predicted protein n=1 Tax=Ajellomyces capsulatus (strain NAm1 / WU24) TaxID=2059318 RepID=UPI000157D3B1|nr:predicted protein [Histoplasma mississippiense (nom. inval.)]EDN04534.1 predicted protein [Histoplasma mississippiense (nom. inval.)]